MLVYGGASRCCHVEAAVMVMAAVVLAIAVAVPHVLQMTLLLLHIAIVARGRRGVVVI